MDETHIFQPVSIFDKKSCKYRFVNNILCEIFSPFLESMESNSVKQIPKTYNPLDDVHWMVRDISSNIGMFALWQIT